MSWFEEAEARIPRGEVRTRAADFSPGEKFEVVFRDGSLPSLALGRQDSLFG